MKSTLQLNEADLHDILTEWARNRYGSVPVRITFHCDRPANQTPQDPGNGIYVQIAVQIAMGGGEKDESNF